MANKNLGELLHAFLHDFSEEEQLRVVKRVEKDNRKAGRILRRAYEMQRAGEEAREIADKIDDLL